MIHFKLSQKNENFYKIRQKQSCQQQTKNRNHLIYYKIFHNENCCLYWKSAFFLFKIHTIYVILL